MDDGDLPPGRRGGDRANAPLPSVKGGGPLLRGNVEHVDAAAGEGDKEQVGAAGRRKRKRLGSGVDQKRVVGGEAVVARHSEAGAKRGGFQWGRGRAWGSGPWEGVAGGGCAWGGGAGQCLSSVTLTQSVGCDFCCCRDGGGSWWSTERDVSHCTVQSALNGFAIHHDLAQMSLLCTGLIYSVVGEEAKGIPH
ncbi:hypothetical protein BU14_0294s0017 [Porphyra umbilicalis]|uniref:Uncharacterized protein n=1 Tax=Porphyra umbilicalis TaxID=2786 RepID=A0A1X6P0N0_PORUM|nr:hypothetical protein BU14_0294s0017 [Porphyra umbilicalis]|eukprot:OSX74326.1 hypothetical protein BU14_0294s0017 [Porphyra umbilicalis]